MHKTATENKQMTVRGWVPGFVYEKQAAGSIWTVAVRFCVDSFPGLYLESQNNDFTLPDIIRISYKLIWGPWVYSFEIIGFTVSAAEATFTVCLEKSSRLATNIRMGGEAEGKWQALANHVIVGKEQRSGAQLLLGHGPRYCCSGTGTLDDCCSHELEDCAHEHTLGHTLFLQLCS